MRIAKLIFALLIALYAVAQAVYFVMLLQGKHTPINVVASAAIFCFAAAISLALFKSALKEPDARP